MPSSTAAACGQRYAQCVNPQWVRLLDVLQMNVRYEHCLGAVLTTSEGKRVLDFLSGYCVHNAGHNHPRIVAARQDEPDQQGPTMLQSHAPNLAGQLAERLLSLAGGRLSRAFFCSSGSEGVEAAIQFARAATGRAALLSAEHGFHGLTCGALSLISDRFWRERFGPLLRARRRWRSATWQRSRSASPRANSPPSSPSRSRARQASACPTRFTGARRRGCAAAMERCSCWTRCRPASGARGRFCSRLAMASSRIWWCSPKALSGGLVPGGALLAMRAGLAALEVMEEERLGEHAGRTGAFLRAPLREALAPYEIVKEVRGEGLLCGIEFTAPRALRQRAAFQAFHRIHPAMFGQVLVMRLFRDHGILAQICGNHFRVLKAAPTLAAGPAQTEVFVRALTNVVDEACHSMDFWTEALGMARRLLHV